MSSVVNILAGIWWGPFMPWSATVNKAFIRMSTQGIPPWALTGATFEPPCAGLFISTVENFHFSALEKSWETVIGSIASYPVMVLFTGSAAKLSSDYNSTGATWSVQRIAFRFLIKQEFFKSSWYWWKDRLMQKLTTNLSLWATSLWSLHTMRFPRDRLANGIWLWDLNLSAH